MSVCCHAYLPTDVDAGKVADAMARMLGAKADYETGPHGRFVRVAGNPRARGVAEVDAYARIDVGRDALARAPSGFDPTFHYTARAGRKGYHMLHLSSSETRVALALRLAKLFGGRVEASDFYGDLTREFPRDRSVPACLADMGDRSFRRWEEALLRVGPLTEEDYRAARRLRPAYSRADERADGGA